MNFLPEFLLISKCSLALSKTAAYQCRASDLQTLFNCSAHGSSTMQVYARSMLDDRVRLPEASSWMSGSTCRCLPWDRPLANHPPSDNHSAAASTVLTYPSIQTVYPPLQRPETLLLISVTGCTIDRRPAPRLRFSRAGSVQSRLAALWYKIFEVKQWIRSIGVRWIVLIESTGWRVCSLGACIDDTERLLCMSTIFLYHRRGQRQLTRLCSCRSALELCSPQIVSS